MSDLIHMSVLNPHPELLALGLWAVALLMAMVCGFASLTSP